MERCEITLSANAGIVLQIKDVRIWIDAIHDEKHLLYDSVSEELWDKIKSNPALRDPDLICFTHCHRDHYSRRMAMEAKQQWPSAKLILPENEFEDQILLYEDEFDILYNGIKLHFFKLPHEGAAYKNVTNYGIIISDGEFRILITGDGEIASNKLLEIMESTPVNLAILNFPWITLSRGRKFVNSILKPEHVLIYHLPADDAFGYCSATRRFIAHIECNDVRVFEKPLDREVILYSN